MELPQSSESSKPTASTRMNYVVPTLDQYDEYFQNREDDRLKLEQMREQYKFDELGYEYGVADAKKLEELGNLLEEVHQLQDQIEKDEELIRNLSIEHAKLDAERKC